MSKGPCTFRKSDIKRGVEALKSVGIAVARIEVQAGKVIFFPHNGAESIELESNPLDNWMATHARSVEGHK
jgi:hypothetical protein